MGQCKICGKETLDDQDICEASQNDLEQVDVDGIDLDFDLEEFDLPELSGDLLETDLEFELEDENNNLENPNIVVREKEPDTIVLDSMDEIPGPAMEENVENVADELHSLEEPVESVGEELPSLDEPLESIVEELPSLEEPVEALDVDLPDLEEVADASDMDLPDLGEPTEVPDIDLPNIADAAEPLDMPTLDGAADLGGEMTDQLDGILSEESSSDGMDLSGLLPEDLMAEVNSEEGPGDELTQLLDEPVQAASDAADDLLGGLDLGFSDTGDGFGIPLDAPDDLAILDELPDAEALAEEAEAKPKVSIWKRLFGNLKDEKWEKQKQKEAKEEAARLAKEEAEKEKKAEEAKAAAGEEGAEGAAQEVDPKEAKKAAKLAKKEEKAKRKAEKKAEKERLKELADEEDGDEGRINRVGAAIVFVLLGAIAAVIIVGTNSFSYKSSISKADKYFKEDEYTEAYSQLAGLAIKADDEELYEKVRTVMYVGKELNSYRNYTNIRMYAEALHSLLKGLEKYDAHVSEAVDLEVSEDYDKLRNKILSEMEKEYDLSEKDAYGLIEMEDQAEYSEKVIAIANK